MPSDVDATRVAVAEVVDERLDSAEGDGLAGTVQEAQARVAARHHQWHVPYGGDIEQYAGQCFLLQPDFDPAVQVSPYLPSVEARCLNEAVFDRPIGLWLPHPSRVVRDVVVSKRSVTTHQDQHPADRLVFLLSLLDEATSYRLVVDLAHRHRRGFVDDRNQCGAHCGHLGFGSATFCGASPTSC